MSAKDVERLLALYEKNANLSIDTGGTHDLGDDVTLLASIDPRGTTIYWVGPGDGSEGSKYHCPPHEKGGKLPDEYKIRVLRARCGRMTRSGKPCRNLPTCRYHQNQRQGGAGTD